ncbi:hypothetical protein JTB14_031392 [Gonioctena quinquepunctata]|nr:hypothetical protein JTB14_031392 [Gonioctena quinquepunctata]
MALYEREQERLYHLILECLGNEGEYDFVDAEDKDELEEDVSETRQSDSDTKQKITDVENEEQDSLGLYSLGKNKVTQWSKHVPHSSRTRAKNLITRLPGPRAVVENLKGAVESWIYFFDLQMLAIKVEYTNQHNEKNAENYYRDRNTKQTDIVEIQALISLIYLAGC